MNDQATGRFNLRKWTVNDSELVQEIPGESNEVGLDEITRETTIATLGSIDG